jgi:hypothetical protein
MQARKLIARALSQNFHAAVVIVAHPSCNAQHVRFPLDKPAEPHALHAPADEKTAGLSRFFSGGHVKCFKVSELQSFKVTALGFTPETLKL